MELERASDPAATCRFCFLEGGNLLQPCSCRGTQVRDGPLAWKERRLGCLSELRNEKWSGEGSGHEEEELCSCETENFFFEFRSCSRCFAERLEIVHMLTLGCTIHVQLRRTDLQQRYIHEECLRKWQWMIVSTSEPKDTRARICNVCNSEFNLAPPKKPLIQRLLDLLLGLLPRNPTYVPAIPGLSAGLLLVASPNLDSPPFKESVILILDHYPPNQHGGTTGVIINGLNPRHSMDCDGQVLVRHQYGGPVESSRVCQILHSCRGCNYSESMLGFESADVDHSGATGSIVYRSMPSASDHILRHCRNDPRDDILINVVFYHGFSAWRPGQLESEIICGDWALCAAEPTDVFDLDMERIWGRLTGSGRLYYPQTRL